MTARNVKGVVLTPNNAPWGNLQIDFILMNGSYAGGFQYPPKTTSILTDAVTGGFTTRLWCNSEGLVDSVYQCRMGYESFKFRLPSDVITDIDISDLRGQTITPITPPIKPTEYNRTFNNADIVTNKLRIDHNLNITNGAVAAVLFSDLNIAMFADIIIINSNSCYLDLTGLTPITGTWSVRIR